MTIEIQRLRELLKEIAVCDSIQSSLAWDQETMMPEKAVEHRSDQMEVIARIAHEKRHSTSFKEMLGGCVNLGTGEPILKDLSAKERALLRDVHRDWKKATSIPVSFMSSYSKTLSLATHAWQEARKRSDFSVFKPHLETVVQMVKEKANYINPDAQTYDVLLDEYEPGMTMSVITPLFNDLKEHCVALLNTVKGSSVSFPDWGKAVFDESKQWDYTIDLLKMMNFDFNRGRQDRSTHPFTIHYHPSDVRVTTRLDSSSIFEAVTGTVHEGGHGLYEQGLDASFYGTPLCESVSLGIHESQSRLWENHVCKSLPFWQGQHSRLLTDFPDALSGFSPEDLYRKVNKVQPGPIRVEADEVSYILHILIRYEIECLLFSNKVEVEHLPELWNEMYRNYLGVSPKNDSEGVLQDIHWSGGSFGYFPTYTLGSLYAAQLFDVMSEELGDIDALIESGDWTPLTTWLNSKVHSHGRFYSPEELMQQATGKPISSDYLLTYLESKVKQIYDA